MKTPNGSLLNSLLKQKATKALKNASTVWGCAAMSVYGFSAAMTADDLINAYTEHTIGTFTLLKATIAIISGLTAASIIAAHFYMAIKIPSERNKTKKWLPFAIPILMVAVTIPFFFMPMPDYILTMDEYTVRELMTTHAPNWLLPFTYASYAVISTLVLLQIRRQKPGWPTSTSSTDQTVESIEAFEKANGTDPTQRSEPR